MTRQAENLIEAREDAPVELRGVLFDAWLLPIILAALEPRQRDVLEMMLIGQSDEPLSTADICEAMETTPERAGLTLSRLRKIGLIQTTHVTDEHGRRAFHIPVEWVRAANRQAIENSRKLWARLITELGL